MTSKGHKKFTLYKTIEKLNVVRFVHVYSVGMMLVRSQMVRSHMVTSYGEKSNGEKLSPYDSQMVREMVTRNQTVTMKSNGETKFKR